MKRVIVTGATSMIGVAVIKECLKNNIEVTAIVRKGSTRTERLPQSSLLKVEYADLSELPELETDLSGDVFYHFGWGHTNRAERDNPALQEENIRTTINAVRLAHKAGCKKFIGAGSQAEYGIVKEIITPETAVNPVTAYGMAKLAAGMLARKSCEQYGMRFVWGRIFSVYGCLDNEGTMINYAIDKFLANETAEFSAATQLWNYLYEQDAGILFFLLGEQTVADGIYCIAGSESLPLKAYINMLCDVYGVNGKANFAEQKQDEKTVSLNADISKTTEATSFVPKVAFKDGIAEVIRYKKQKRHEGISEK